MGQNFRILDIDGRDHIGGSDKLGCFFWDSATDIMDSLRVPQTKMKFDEMLRGAVADQRSSTLLRLPADLFDPVMRELMGAHTKDILSVLSLAVTCKTVLALSRKHIVILQRQHHHSRVGHRLICVGEYTNDLECLPRGMLTAEEEQEVVEFAKHYDGGEEPPSHYLYAAETYTWPKLFFQDDSELARIFRASATPRRWLCDDWALACSVACPYYPTGRIQVLCNLTKHEYVREDTAGQLCESLHEGGFYKKPGFWHFLLASICWSPDCTIAMPYDDECRNEDGTVDFPLTRGRWAGDRFAITILDGLAAQGKGPWKDVTDEVGELIRRMWDAEID